jgi:3'-phosphoadenosine 5'-phosphosulfate sulfotransferase (PAPS reductase)/FAD synthetase
MNKKREGEFYSRVYEERPEYADYPPEKKFDAIQGIIMTRLNQHPKAICSYSGGSDSDILIDIIERTRNMIPGHFAPVKYVFFNTGLEMQATKSHVKEVAEKYNVDIDECRPKKNIVKAVRDHGVPFLSKIVSNAMETVQAKGVPFTIKEEYDNAEDKQAKYKELVDRYPGAKNAINFLCCCNKKGDPRPEIQLVIGSNKYLYEYMRDNPPPFRMSAKCCDYCKKQVAHNVQKGYEMIITGERRDEGGMRSVPKVFDDPDDTMCFYAQGDQFRFRPLFFVSDTDKAWYKEHYGLRYSDAYEVYGLKRTGCCGCSISSKAIEDLEKIRPFEPNLVKAAWNVFGESYRYRQGYNEYKAKMRLEESGQITFLE